MSKDDITQIRINNSLIGIVGLQQVMEKMVGQVAGLPDEDIGAEMILRLSEYNYIPNSARDLYRMALVREFKKYLGQTVDDRPLKGLRIAVLGPGCARCSQMEMDVREILAEMKLAAELIHVDDMREIGKYGVMGVPALVINDRVVSVGTTPHRNKIKEWLQETQEKDKS